MALDGTTSAPTGSETILLVEPDAAARSLTAFMLSKRGYSVIEARNAAEAIDLFERHTGSIDLLFTEAITSRLNGHELARTLAERAPRLPVLYLCDPECARMTRRLAANKSAILSRPYTVDTLASKVRQVLDRVRPKVMTAGRV
jgi:two-component system cell cycle sensor histidine kinase/response regulator CckA